MTSEYWREILALARCRAEDFSRRIVSMRPVTLGDLAREGRLRYCLKCGYEREVDPLSLGIDAAEAEVMRARRRQKHL